jgi:serine/threonine-protein kinase
MAGAQEQPPGSRKVRAAERPQIDHQRLVGQVIAGRYHIEALIGEGGMGAVYRAQHTGMKKRLAVKVLHPEMLGLNEAVERFEREAIAGAHIEHPNVAAATDFGKLEDGSYFLALELLEGEHLRKHIERGPLKPARALRIARQIALALRAVHALGIVHRDLKPDNVMLVRKDRESEIVKILDFGIAKVPVDTLAATRPGFVPQLTKSGMAYGTPEYMAPEQALGEEIDGRVDLYALGVILYEMLAGARPFDAESRVALLGMVASKPAPPLAERAPRVNVPAKVEAIAMRLLEKRPEARYANADAVIAAIDEALGALDRAAEFSSAPEFEQRSAFGEAATVYAANPPPSVQRPSALPEPRPMGLRGVPVFAKLAGVGLVGIALVVVAAVSLRSKGSIEALEQQDPRATTADAAAPEAPGTTDAAAPPAPGPDAAPPAPAKATADELDQARVQGLAALQKLEERYPADASVHKALMVAYVRDRSGYVAALREARRVLELSPERVSDPDVARAMKMVANGQPEVADGALDLMAKGMGNAGPDLLYELLIAPGIGKFTKDRARDLLKDEGVRKNATPALLVAFDLHMAVQTSPCNQDALFERARDEGDGRALPSLQQLLAKKRGCGLPLFGDCWACLGARAPVREALQAIKKRIGKP